MIARARGTLFGASLAMLSASGALAQCPVAEDLEGGIRVDFADGYYEVYRAASPGVVELVGGNVEGMYYRMQLGHGQYLLSHVDVLEGGAEDTANATSYDYGLPPARMPQPAPGGRWDVVPSVSFADAGPVPEAQSAVFGPLQQVTIGTCHYEGFEVITAFDTPEAYLEGAVYLPALGFGWMSWSQDDLGGRAEYSAVSIAPLGATGQK